MAKADTDDDLDLEDDADTDDEGDDFTEDEAEEPEANANDDLAMPGTDEGGAKDTMANVTQLLADNCGVKMPEGKEYKNLEDFLSDLEVALGAYKHAKEYHGVENPGGEAEGGETETPGEAEGATEETPTGGMGALSGIAMSHEQERMSKIAMSMAKTATDNEAKRMASQMRKMVRRGQITPAKYEEWKKVLLQPAKRLSLFSPEDDPEVKRVLTEFNFARKNVGAGNVVALGEAELPVSLSTAREEPAPAWADMGHQQGLDPEIMARMTGGRWKPPQSGGSNGKTRKK